MLTPTFLYAGRAVLTVSNNKGQHYTFQVKQAKDWNQNTRYFVSLRTGENYTYLGMFSSDTLYPTKASKMRKNSTPFKVFNFAVRIINGVQELPAGYKIQHEGKCGKCGKPLTNPVSIETGIGPTCAGRIQ